MDAEASVNSRGAGVRAAPSAQRREMREAIEAALAGRSPSMRRLRQRIEGMAPLWIPVLLRGEPGSGRATAAALLHAWGPAARGELVRIDAAAFVPERRLPALATVLLESVERLSRGAQAWWLYRLRAAQVPGAARGIRWLATSGDAPSLREAAPDFDPALERVLASFAIRVPPLRERTGDLPLLAADLCARIGSALGRERVRVSAPALAILASCHWPGNVRELEDVLMRAIAFTPSPRLGRALVADVLSERGESVGGLRAEGKAREREELLARLRATAGNVARTAEALGRSRTAVYRLIAKHRIPLSWHRGAASAARGARASGRGAGRGPGPRAGPRR
jgi:DNA-binding NtrC family response regulator